MKKGYIKLIILNIILIISLVLSSFISNILNYTNLVVFLLALTAIYKYLFGFEKDNHRYIKDICFNFLIIILSFLLIYYLLGLVIGFVRTPNYYTVHSFRTLIIPYILIIIIKEYLRYQMLSKAGDNKKIIVLIFITFLLMDILGNVQLNKMIHGYELFLLFSLTLLPSISRNIAAIYIARRVGYKPNILWISIFSLYGVLIPIVPNSGLYIGSMINLLLPVGIAYNVYSFFLERSKQKVTRDKLKRGIIYLPILAVYIITIVYFTSGLFRYYTIAIATGSMTPNINKGDVVIVDKKYSRDDLKAGRVIAYKYNKIIIVHRIVDLEEVDGQYYIYTKGDSNNGKDGYIVYEKMVVGIVEQKIPYIGLPTIWINEL